MTPMGFAMGQRSDEFMSYADISRETKVPESTVRYWVHMGQGPPSYKLGRHRRFRRSDVEAWLEERADDRAPAA